METWRIGNSYNIYGNEGFQSRFEMKILIIEENIY